MPPRVTLSSDWLDGVSDLPHSSQLSPGVLCTRRVCSLGVQRRSPSGVGSPYLLPWVTLTISLLQPVGSWPPRSRSSLAPCCRSLCLAAGKGVWTWKAAFTSWGRHECLVAKIFPAIKKTRDWGHRRREKKSGVSGLKMYPSGDPSS